jgi:hypothetical protein
MIGVGVRFGLGVFSYGSLSLSNVSRFRFSLFPEVSFSGVAGGSIEGRTSSCDDLVADLVFVDAFEGAFALPLAPFGLGMAVGVFKV